MTALLWAGAGAAIGCALLHGAIGLQRPSSRTYLSFAFIMALVAAYLYFGRDLYRADSTAAAVEAVRRQVVVAHGFIACIVVFFTSYSQIRISRLAVSAYWIALAILFVANLWSPYGVWFSAEPELVHATFRGEPYNAVIAPPMSPLQYVHALYVAALFALGFGGAVHIYRRGEHSRGLTLAVSLLVVLVAHAADVVRDAVGGAWPYVTELGLVTWGFIMSVQLALEFRSNERRLRSTLGAAALHATALAAVMEESLRVRDKVNTPLQTIELGLAMLDRRAPEQQAELESLQHMVDELTQTGRAVERAATRMRRAREAATR